MRYDDCASFRFDDEDVTSLCICGVALVSGDGGKKGVFLEVVVGVESCRVLSNLILVNR